MAKEVVATRRKQLGLCGDGLVEFYEQKKPALWDRGSFFMIFRKKRDHVCTLLLDGMTRGALKCQLNPSAVLEKVFGHSDRKKVEITMRPGKGRAQFIFN